MVDEIRRRTADHTVKDVVLLERLAEPQIGHYPLLKFVLFALLRSHAYAAQVFGEQLGLRKLLDNACAPTLFGAFLVGGAAGLRVKIP